MLVQTEILTLIQTETLTLIQTETLTLIQIEILTLIQTETLTLEIEEEILTSVTLEIVMDHEETTHQVQIIEAEDHPINQGTERVIEDHLLNQGTERVIEDHRLSLATEVEDERLLESIEWEDQTEHSLVIIQDKWTLTDIIIIGQIGIRQIDITELITTTNIDIFLTIVHSGRTVTITRTQFLIILFTGTPG